MNYASLASYFPQRITRLAGLMKIEEETIKHIYRPMMMSDDEQIHQKAIELFDLVIMQYEVGSTNAEVQDEWMTSPDLLVVTDEGVIPYDSEY